MILKIGNLYALLAGEHHPYGQGEYSSFGLVGLFRALRDLPEDAAPTADHDFEILARLLHDGYIEEVDATEVRILETWSTAKFELHIIDPEDPT